MRHRPRRQSVHDELNLTAMVDMLVNILIFLLALYGTGTIDLPQAKGLTLPDSASKSPIERSATVTITNEVILADGQTVARLTPVNGVPTVPTATPERVIPALASWLAEKVDAHRQQPAPPDGSPPAPMRLVVQCDREVPWSVVDLVLATAASVGITNEGFVVRTATEKP